MLQLLYSYYLIEDNRIVYRSDYYYESYEMCYYIAYNIIKELQNRDKNYKFCIVAEKKVVDYD